MLPAAAIRQGFIACHKHEGCRILLGVPCQLNQGSLPRKSDLRTLLFHSVSYSSDSNFESGPKYLPPGQDPLHQGPHAQFAGDC